MRELTVLSRTNCLNLDKQTGYPTRTTLRTMTSTRLASSGFSEWGAKSRGLLKPGLGHSYLRIFIQLNNLTHPPPPPPHFLMEEPWVATSCGLKKLTSSMPYGQEF